MRCFAFGGGGSGVIVSFWKKHKTMVCAICVSLPQQVFVAGPPPKKKKRERCQSRLAIVVMSLLISLALQKLEDTLQLRP